MIETRPDGLQYTTVAASQTGAKLGTTGRVGGVLNKILVVPASTSPGAIAILDGATSITVFAGGASSVADLKPFVLDVNLRAAGAWTVTTGANVSIVCAGFFD